MSVRYTKYIKQIIEFPYLLNFTAEASGEESKFSFGR